MKRSLAPSVVRNRLVDKENNRNSEPISAGKNETVIQRMPLFGFLSIPANLNKQFKIPSGCKITEESIALRKTKTLGLNKRFKIVQAGDYRPPLPGIVLADAEEAEDEDGESTASLPPFERLVLWTDPTDEENTVEVVPELASKLRPHQREGVQFLFECTMGMRGFEGQGCILADDMGLGKTLMSITILWTLLNQSIEKAPGASAVKKVIVVCPTSLVGNWDNEIRRWIGDRCHTFAVKSDPQKMVKLFLQHRGKGVLIISYETQRRYSNIFMKHYQTAQRSKANTDDLPFGVSNNQCCDLLICDEAHKLKNAESGLAKALSELPAKKRILLSGTPMQNELTEFYNMVNFCNPNILGLPGYFRKVYERPILQSREPGASRNLITKAGDLQRDLSTIVNEFILKRGNILNAQHLPPKLVQFVCCRLTPLQEALYDELISSKDYRYLRDARHTNTLNSIRLMLNICSHPRMILANYEAKVKSGETDEELASLVKLIPNESISSLQKPSAPKIHHGMERRHAGNMGVKPKADTATKGAFMNPFESGKLLVLFRMLQTMRAMRNGDRIVIVSNYTSTLDVIEDLCKANGWPSMRLDGSTNGTKRSKLVDDFNDPGSGAFVFLLSSKAGGCGINLIGGNRLVLFDPDWNPASDKQAAARIWREGQKKRCFIYRFMSTGTVEEKIIQRQLSKEGLQNIVDDTEQVNTFSTTELKALFVRHADTVSDTHDTLKCTRCSNVVSREGFERPEKMKMNVDQRKICLDFLLSFIPVAKEFLGVNKSGCDSADGEPVYASIDDLNDLSVALEQQQYDTIPSFSRRLREVVMGIDAEQQQLAQAGHRADVTQSIANEFIHMWSGIISQLTESKTVAAPSGLCSDHADQTAGQDGDNNDTDGPILDDFAEQEGCPEESDFNKWSHHSSVQTCDDDCLKKAMGDDPTVSFVFGLEVNWTLLQARVEEQREKEEMRKEQQRIALAELNIRRNKLKAGNGKGQRNCQSDSDSSDSDCEVADIVPDKKDKTVCSSKESNETDPFSFLDDEPKVKKDKKGKKNQNRVNFSDSDPFVFLEEATMDSGEGNVSSGQKSKGPSPSKRLSPRRKYPQVQVDTPCDTVDTCETADDSVVQSSRPPTAAGPRRHRPINAVDAGEKKSNSVVDVTSVLSTAGRGEAGATSTTSAARKGRLLVKKVSVLEQAEVDADDGDDWMDDEPVSTSTHQRNSCTEQSESIEIEDGLEDSQEQSLDTSSTNDSQSQSPSSQYQTWSCKACTFENSYNLKKKKKTLICSICGQKTRVSDL